MEATCIRIYLNELDMYKNTPLHRAILNYLNDADIAGASVIREYEGFGQHKQVHTPVVLRLSENMPLIIEVVDTKNHIEEVLAKLQEMAKGHLITSHTVTIIQGK